MNKRQKMLTRWVIVLVTLAVVISIVAVVVNRGNDGKKHVTLPLPTGGPGLEGSAAQLATLLAESRNHTFHASYGVHGDPKVIGGELTLEWWNVKGRSRVDTIRTRGSQMVHTASFVNGADGASCQRVNNGAWSCQSITVPAPGDPGGLIASLTSQLSGRPVTERAGKVGGRSALCFHVGGGSEPIDVCTNSDGVLLRNASAKVTYEVSTLDQNVPSSIFKTPAVVR